MRTPDNNIAIETMDKSGTACEIRPASLALVRDMRHRVMYPSLSPEAVILPDDESGTHLGLWADGRLVSVISCFDRGDSLQFRKFATETAMQGKGYGSAMLAFVMQDANARGKKKIWCNARVSATALYQKFGMTAVGEPWEQYGLAFIKMEKELG